MAGSGTNPADATDFGGILPSGTVSFAPGETSKTLTITVSGDTQSEGNEAFLVALSGATNSAAIDAAAASGTIIDDENSAPTDVNISQSAIAENVPVGSTVGNLSTIDSDIGNSFTYALISGTGDTDNASFSIAGTNSRQRRH